MQIQINQRARYVWASLPATAQGRLDFVFESTWLFGLAMVAFLYNGNNYLFFFTQPKQYMVHLLGIILLVLWIFEFALNWRPSSAKTATPAVALWKRPVVWAGRDPSKWLLVFVGFFGVGQVLSAIFSQSPSTSILGRNPNDPGYEAYAVVAYLLILVSIALKMKTKDQVIRLLRVVVLVATATSLYGVLQFYGWDPFGFGDELAFNGTRIFSTYGNPIFFGSFILMTIPLTMTWALLELKKGRYWILAIAIASLGLQVSGIWFTSSRGPFIGAFIVAIPVMFAACLLFCNRKVFYKLVGIGASTALVSVLLILVVTGILAGSSEDERAQSSSVVRGERVLSSIGQVTSGGDVNSFSNGRLDIWRGALELLVSRESVPVEEGFLIKTIRHIFGYGQERYYLIYPLTASPSSEFASASHAHNFVLQIWLELGLWGLISFIGITISALWILVKLSIRSWRERGSVSSSVWLNIVIAGLWAVLIARGVEQIPGVGRISDLLLFWMILGFAAAVYRIATYEYTDDKFLRAPLQKGGRPAGLSNTSEAQRSHRTNQKRRKGRNLPRVGRGYDPKPALMIVAIIAAISGAVAFIVVDVNPIRGSVSAIKAINKLRCPDGRDASQYLTYMGAAVEYAPKSEEFAVRYAEQTLNIIDRRILEWDSASDADRPAIEMFVNRQLDVAVGVLDNHLLEVPYSHNTLLRKLSYLGSKRNWLNTIDPRDGSPEAAELAEEIRKVTEEYVSFLDELSEYFRPFTSAMVSLITHYASLRMFDEAVELSQYILDTPASSNFDRAVAHAVIGTHASNTEDYDKAIEHLELAIVQEVIISGDATITYFTLGESYRRADRLTEAIHAYNRAVYMKDRVTVRAGQLPIETVNDAIGREYGLREFLFLDELRQAANAVDEIPQADTTGLLAQREALLSAMQEGSDREEILNAIELQLDMVIEELEPDYEAVVLMLTEVRDELQLLKRAWNKIEEVPMELLRRDMGLTASTGTENSSVSDVGVPSEMENEETNLVDCEYTGQS